MSFEQIASLLEESRKIDQFSPEGTQGGAFCVSLLEYNNTKRAVVEKSQQEEHSKQAPVSPGGVKSSENFNPWGQKERRAYHRINSGFQIADFTGARLRFLTLTTAPSAVGHDLKRDCDILLKRVRRRYKGAKIDFFKVRTNEGHGVLHLLCRGAFIPRAWLSKTWSEIHTGSWSVDIRDAKRYHKAYIVNQYLCCQEASYTRYSRSLEWIPKGALAVWKGFCKWYPGKAKVLWARYLEKRVTEPEKEPPPRRDCFCPIRRHTTA